MDLTDLTLVALIWNPQSKSVEKFETTKDQSFKAQQKIEKSRSDGKWVVSQFVYVTKTGEYAGAWG